MAPAVLLRVASQTISIVVFAAFLLGTPWRAFCGRLNAPDVLASSGLWALYLAFLAAYVAVVIEPRYLAPVVAWSTLVGAANLTWLLTKGLPIAPWGAECPP
jgi:hypothetical protein